MIQNHGVALLDVPIVSIFPNGRRGQARFGRTNFEVFVWKVFVTFTNL
jgi:hypothetical protein